MEEAIGWKAGRSGRTDRELVWRPAWRGCFVRFRREKGREENFRAGLLLVRVLTGGHAVEHGLASVEGRRLQAVEGN